MAVKNFKTNYGLATTNNAVAATVRPSILLDFARGRVLDPRATFARASNATFTAANGLISTATAGNPRFDYDPVTHECKGLLIEDGRTNRLGNNTLMHTWGTSAVTITANAVSAPDGTLTATKITETTDNTRHYIAPTYYTTLTANSYVSGSVFAKAAERSHLQLFVGLAGSPYTRAGVVVNLTTGSATVSNIGSPLEVYVSAQPYGNGWYRAMITARIDTTSTNIGYMEVTINDGSTVNYAGDGTSGIYVWGAQVEQGYGSTSFIYTGPTGATRDTETLYIQSPTQWFNPTEGTLYTESYRSFPAGPGQSRILAGIEDNPTGSGSFQRQWIWGGAPSQILTSIYFNNSLDAESGYFFTNNAISKTAIAYSNGVYYSAFNGTPNGATGTVRIRNFNNPTLCIGNSNGGFVWNGHIAKVAYYPSLLSSAEVVAVTQV